MAISLWCAPLGDCRVADTPNKKLQILTVPCTPAVIARRFSAVAIPLTVLTIGRSPRRFAPRDDREFHPGRVGRRPV